MLGPTMCQSLGTPACFVCASLGTSAAIIWLSATSPGSFPTAPLCSELPPHWLPFCSWNTPSSGLLLSPVSMPRRVYVLIKAGRSSKKSALYSLPGTAVTKYCKLDGKTMKCPLSQFWRLEVQPQDVAGPCSLWGALWKCLFHAFLLVTAGGLPVSSGIRWLVHASLHALLLLTWCFPCASSHAFSWWMSLLFFW